MGIKTLIYFHLRIHQPAFSHHKEMRLVTLGVKPSCYFLAIPAHFTANSNKIVMLTVSNSPIQAWNSLLTHSSHSVTSHLLCRMDSIFQKLQNHQHSFTYFKISQPNFIYNTEAPSQTELTSTFFKAYSTCCLLAAMMFSLSTSGFKALY